MRQIIRRLLAALCVLSLLTATASALTVEEALDLLETYYVNPIPDEAYEAQDLDALFAALGDPYTFYMSAEEYEAFLSSVESDTTVTGIGAAIQYTDEGILLVDILRGSGAEDVGLVGGDLIIAAEGTSCVPAGEAHRNLLVGEEGTYVTITVRHADGTVQDYRVQRRTLVIHNTETTLLEDGVGYIDCDSFGSETGSYFAQGIETYDDDARIWIVDLRGNLGGITTTAVEATGAFTGSGFLLYLRDQSGSYSRYIHFDDPLTADPVIVLTDAYSASASEVFAGDIRDARAGISVGTRTYGKGVAQIVLDQENTPDLFDGDCLKITAYRFYTVGGSTTDKIGVIPTLLIENADAETVALALCGEEPQRPDGQLKVELAGWDFYIDPAACQGDTLQVVLGALAPDVSLWLGTDGQWVPITPAMALTLYDAQDYCRWFDDVSGSAYASEINTLATYGILRGGTDGAFRPADTITRAEVCALLAQAIGVTYTGEGPFSDVPSEKWFAGSVNAMAAMELVSGKGGGCFDPYAPMTNQEFFTILGRLASYLNFNADEYAASLDQADLEADPALTGYASWARTGVDMLTGMLLDSSGAALNLLYDDVTAIDPQAPILREQAAATLCNLLVEMDFLVY